MATLTAKVVPAEAMVQAALKQFQEAASRNDAAKGTAIETMSTTISGIVVGLAVFLVAGIAALAFLIGRAGSRPVSALTSAMKELADGNFNVVLPGLGRKDEIGEIAAAVDSFKVKAAAKAGRDAEGKGGGGEPA